MVVASVVVWSTVGRRDSICNYKERRVYFLVSKYIYFDICHANFISRIFATKLGKVDGGICGDCIDKRVCVTCAEVSCGGDIVKNFSIVKIAMDQSSLYGLKYGTGVSRGQYQDWRDRLRWRILLQIITPQPGGKLLDVGCNDGKLVDRFRKLGWDAQGIDVNEEIIKKSQVKGITFMSAEKLDLSSEYFDVVTSIHSIEHMLNPGIALGEMIRVLKIGGKLVLFYPAEPVRGLWAIGDAWNSYGNLLESRSLHIHKLNPKKVSKLMNRLPAHEVNSKICLLPFPDFVSVYEKTKLGGVE